MHSVRPYGYNIAEWRNHRNTPSANHRNPKRENRNRPPRTESRKDTQAKHRLATAVKRNSWKAKAYVVNEEEIEFLDPETIREWSKQDISVIYRLKRLTDLYRTSGSKVFDFIQDWTEDTRSITKLWMYNHIPWEDRTTQIIQIEDKIKEYNRHGWETHTSSGVGLPKSAKKQKKVNKDRHFIKFEHMHRESQLTAIRKVIRETAEIHPEPTEGAELMVCDKLQTPVGWIMCNFTEESLNLEQLSVNTKVDTTDR